MFLKSHDYCPLKFARMDQLYTPTVVGGLREIDFTSKTRTVHDAAKDAAVHNTVL